MADVNFQKMLRPGDRINFSGGKEKYTSKVDQITSETTFVIMQPVGKLLNFRASIGDEFNVIVVSDLGLHCFQTKCIAVDNSGVKTMELKFTGNYNRIQNRQSYRSQVSLPVELRRRPRTELKEIYEEKPKPKTGDWRSLIPLTGEAPKKVVETKFPEPPVTGGYWISAKTMDISEGGMKLRLDNSFSAGDLVQIKLHVNKYGYDTLLPVITGHIVRAQPADDRSSDVICGVEFLNLDPKAKNLLSKFVMTCQRNDRSFKK